MEKITQDPEQAPKIAEIIDTSEGDIFRDFDLSTFISHFNLDPLAKTLLASAFTHVSKSDLKTKGMSSLFPLRPRLLIWYSRGNTVQRSGRALLMSGKRSNREGRCTPITTRNLRN